jgi:hypothetical protein
VSLTGRAVTGDLRNMNNDMFHEVHISPNAVRVIETRRMKWEALGI